MSFSNIGLEEVKLEGFQIVSADMFSRFSERKIPAMTIWYASIAFNKMAFSALNNCENIKIHVNEKNMEIVIAPTTENEKNKIRWLKMVKGKPEIRKMKCAYFTKELYSSWKLDPNQYYRAPGRLVLNENKVMLLFEFKKADGKMVRILNE